MEDIKNHKYLFIMIKFILLLLFFISVGSCSSIKIERHSFSNRFFICSLTDDFPEKGKMLVLNSPFKQHWKSFSFVNVFYQNDSIILSNIYPSPAVTFLGSYSADKYSVTFLDNSGKVINDITHDLILNDSIFISNKYYFMNPPCQFADKVSKIKLILPYLNFSYTDTIPKTSCDSLVFKVDSDIPLFFENHEYSFQDYCIKNPFIVTNFSDLKDQGESKMIFFWGRLGNYKKDFLDKKTIRQMQKFNRFR